MKKVDLKSKKSLLKGLWMGLVSAHSVTFKPNGYNHPIETTNASKYWILSIPLQVSAKHALFAKSVYSLIVTA